MQQGRARRSRKRSHLRSHRGHRPAETPIALPTGNAVLSAANAADDGGAGGAVPGNGPALQGGCQDPRWRIAEEGPGETGPVSITDGNSIPRSAIPFYSHNAEYLLRVDDEFAGGWVAQICHFWRSGLPGSSAFGRCSGWLLL